MASRWARTGRTDATLRASRWARTGRTDATLRAASGYLVLSALAISLALVVRDGWPWIHPSPWLSLPPLAALLTSAALGLALAAGVVAMTRVAVARFGWARRLHSELRPVALDLSLGQVLLLAGLSSLGEELLFRGLLTPLLGVALSALLFGLMHQMRGPSRWVWVGWAVGVGAGLGAIFAATGSLVGPFLAHAVVNAVNLSYLRDHDPGEAEQQATL
ncbi:CPBP family intramembrane glutamic endopeptidase [Sorangium sp. So ce341]|uniref:CPBP family intramembrane glutamic endopeptidase n=1 Tax=Sorangium sp. So ce341 TaxID=3133302 RepID=UPI003F5FE5CF